jgi:pimeloyl-ACP methyl ester carboxylesterase
MRSTLRSISLAVAALILGVALLPTPAFAAPRASRLACRDGTDMSRPITLSVEGEPATGHYAMPSRTPTQLIVIGHGFGHTSFSWVEHMRRFARNPSEGGFGVAAVTMDYRGLKILPDDNADGLPESRGLPVMNGAEDLIAAATALQAACPTIETTILLAVSGGGAMSGVALALAGQKGITQRGGGPLFDYWLEVEGVANLVETYLEARAAEVVLNNETARKAKADIERETGGTIEEHPEAYVERTVVARVEDIEASGVKGVVLVHGVDDGLVPYNQSRELATLLGFAGIPTDLFTVGRRSPQSERETTLTGHVAGSLDPDYTSPLAGHGSEKSTTHIVMVTAFRRLAALLRGNAPETYQEFVVDGEMGTFGPIPGP